MLIQFTVSNFLSIKDAVTLNMLALNPIKEFKDTNVFKKDRYSFLKSAVIYGANASGKSNILYAIDFYQWFILHSSTKMEIDEKIEIEQFKLSDESRNEPSTFESSFLIEDTKYRYGFEVDKNKVLTEWLFYSKKKKEYPLFIRSNQDIEIYKAFSEGKGIEGRTRKNVLFLSVVAQFNGSLSQNILNYFSSINSISGISDDNYEGFTASLLGDGGFGETIVHLMKIADFGFKDIKRVDMEVTEDSLPPHFTEDFKKMILKDSDLKNGYNLETYHVKNGQKGEKEEFVKFDFDEEESEGTKKFFRLTGPILETLVFGGVIIIDELDARLHPALTKGIVGLFNNPGINRNNAQLIFATHDTNLLSSCLFRRDQIWFTEKRRDGSTDLYSLAEYKLDKSKVRNDAKFERDYIKGRYGAIPYVGDFDSLLNSSLWQE